MDSLHELNGPDKIIEKMLKKDAFSNWLGLKVDELHEGYSACSCIVKEEMLNGFSIAHGGIAYSLADTTLAFAANSYGKQSFSIETSISHLQKVNANDHLFARSKEIHRGKKTGVYHVHVYNQNETLVAIFKGTVYISKIPW
ncbi:hotdog fold thioesterase [Crocinitomicaceae bacterium]|nr:hotdog fold thioesterase [Crocinitomicaceae bacterium]